jgi:hypothetical protein
MYNYYRYTILLWSLILLPVNAYSQYQHTPVKLTYGNDRNPSFQVRNGGEGEFSNVLYEFMAYERVNGGAVNIFVSKINTSGALDSGTNLTNNSFVNINPSIGIYKIYYYNNEIVNSLVVWETNKNGNKDVYARIYKQNQGWFSEFPIDSSSGDQTNPQVALINQNTYAVVYKSVNDIKLKIINIDNQSILKDTNLTSGIGEICRNPYVIVSNTTPRKIFISYEREYSSAQNSIYCLKADTISSTLSFSVDTVRYSGVNYNAGFNGMTLYPNPYVCVYENYSNGKRNTYGAEIKWNGQSSVNHSILTSTVNDMWSYKGSEYILGDNTLNGCYGYLTRISNSVYAKTKMGYSWDSVMVLVSNDTNYSSKIALSAANTVPNTACFRMWYVFEKNLGASDKGIYGISFTTCAMKVRKISEIAKEYSLEQNYPNPFNPSTSISFHLSATGQVSLKVYDVTGREVLTLVNQVLQPGIYETVFEGSQLNSGVYFYRLKTGDFLETKKMMLIK